MIGEIFKFLVGAVLSPLMLMPVLLITAVLDDSPEWMTHFSDFFRFVYPVGFVGVVMFGIPCYLLLRYFGYANYITLAGAGIAGGAMLGATAKPVIGSMLLYGTCGFLVSTGFWLVAVHVPMKLVRHVGSNQSPNKDTQ